MASNERQAEFALSPRSAHAHGARRGGRSAARGRLERRPGSSSGSPGRPRSGGLVGAERRREPRDEHGPRAGAARAAAGGGSRRPRGARAPPARGGSSGARSGPSPVESAVERGAPRSARRRRPAPRGRRSAAPGRGCRREQGAVVVDDDDRARRRSSSTDPGRRDRLAFAQVREERRHVAAQHDLREGRAVVEVEAVVGDVGDQPADPDALADVVEQRREVGVRRDVDAAGAGAGAVGRRRAARFRSCRRAAQPPLPAGPDRDVVRRPRGRTAKRRSLAVGYGRLTMPVTVIRSPDDDRRRGDAGARLAVDRRAWLPFASTISARQRSPSRSTFSTVPERRTSSHSSRSAGRPAERRGRDARCPSPSDRDGRRRDARRAPGVAGRAGDPKPRARPPAPPMPAREQDLDRARGVLDHDPAAARVEQRRAGGDRAPRSSPPCRPA